MECSEFLCTQNNFLGQKFEKLMKCRNEIVLLFIAYFRGWISKLANSSLR